MSREGSKPAGAWQVQRLHDAGEAADGADAAVWAAIEAGFAHSFKDCRPPEVWAWRYQRPTPGAAAAGPGGPEDPGCLGCLGVALYAEPAGPDTLAAFIGASVHRGWCAAGPARFLLARDHFSAPQLRGPALSRRGAMAAAEAAFHGDCVANDAGWLFGVAVERWARLSALQGKTRISTGGQWYRSQLRPGQAAASLCVVRQADFKDPAWDHFWQQRQTRVACSVVRDASFLAWRFDARQGRDYWCLALHSLLAEAPLGFLVLTTAAPHQADPGVAVLVDLALPENPQLAVHAWGQAQAWLLAHGISRVDTLAAAALPERRLLPYLGFVPCPPPLPVLPVFASYAAGLDPEYLEAHYAYTLADSDLY